VTEPFGQWFGAAVLDCDPQTTPSAKDCAAKMRELMVAFFRPALNDDSVADLTRTLAEVTPESLTEFDGRDEPGMPARRAELVAAAAAATGQPVVQLELRKGEPEDVLGRPKLAEQPDDQLTAQQLDEKYNPNGDGEHPTIWRSHWREAVEQHHTIVGYWDWVVSQLQAEQDDPQ
jgi:hypothetical protein